MKRDGGGATGRPREPLGPPVESIRERLEDLRRENARLFDEVVAGEHRLRGLARAVWRVQEEERRRLARELHDGLGQTLTALKNQLEWLARRSAAGSEAAQEASLAAQVAGQALQETRELSRLLRPAALDDMGLETALRSLCRSLAEGTGLAIDLEAQGLDRRLDADLETVVFRIAQEALANVLRHSGAERARLAVECADGRIRLLVADRGRGFDPAAPGGGGDGIGLRGIRDRVELFGGRFQLESRPGEGTRLAVELPLGREALAR